MKTVRYAVVLPTYKLEEDKYKSVYSKIVYKLSYLKSLVDKEYNVVRFNNFNKKVAGVDVGMLVELNKIDLEDLDYSTDAYVKVGTFEIDSVDDVDGLITIEGNLKIKSDFDFNKYLDLNAVGKRLFNKNEWNFIELLGFELYDIGDRNLFFRSTEGE